MTTLTQKLCDSLGPILGDKLLAKDNQRYFNMPCQLIDEFGRPEDEWLMNPNEAHVSVILVVRALHIQIESLDRLRCC